MKSNSDAYGLTGEEVSEAEAYLSDEFSNVESYNDDMMFPDLRDTMLLPEEYADLGISDQQLAHSDGSYD